MKVDVLSLDGKKVKDISLPSQFNEEVRKDLIKRAVQVIRNNLRQKYGAKDDAGKRYSATLSRRRRDYRGAYGMGISRVPRKIHTRRGRRMFWVGTLAPGTVGGRKAHPPKSRKNLSLNINKKEKRKAIRSALSSTTNLDLVKGRGHLVDNALFVLENKFEDISRTKDVEKVLVKVGLEKELGRVNEKKIRAGKGKMRGRKYKLKKGPLLIVSKKCKLIKASQNLLGVDVVKVNYLNTDLLAPGTMPGRLCVWSEDAIERLSKENLFFDNIRVKKEKVKETKK